MTSAVFKSVRKLPVVNERLNKLSNWSEILFLSGFNTLVGILYGQFIFESTIVGERRKE